jgi:hypothetical protein
MASKIILLLLLGVAAVVMVPSLRQEVWPKVQPAFNPLYEWSAKNRVAEIRDMVKRADAVGRTVPLGGDEFDRFVQNEGMQENASEDPWGSQYYILLTGNYFQIGSPGKDRQAGTTDDILTRPEPLSHVPDTRRRF